MPLVANYSISKLYCLVMFSLDGKVAFQFSTVPNTSNATVAFFKQAIPKFIYTNSQKKLTIVLDNAAVQKTAELKGLVEVLPINLLYNIPCSPFLNPVEDFFMEIKKSFKTHYHQQRENCLFGMLQSFKNVIKRGNFDWMIRKMAVNLQRRLQVHGFDIIQSNPVMRFLNKRNPEDEDDEDSQMTMVRVNPSHDDVQLPGPEKRVKY